MTVDIAKARALAGKLRNCDSIYYESSMTRNYRLEDEVDAAADTIDALLNEVERLNSPVALSEWQKLVAERDALAREVDACAAALPGPYYMDPPDGGDVPISEQVKRMARDAARYRWLRDNPWPDDLSEIIEYQCNARWDTAIDEAMKGASDES